MTIHSRTTSCITGFVILLGLAWNGTVLAAGQSGAFYKLSDYLPVSADGYRYTSVPYGEIVGILKVVAKIKTHGSLQRISTRGMDIPNKSGNSIVAQIGRAHV